MRVRGFSLVEWLISLMAVTVFGMLILRLLILSGQTLNRAEELEQAVAMISELINMFKGHTSAHRFLSDEGLLPYTLTHTLDQTIIVQKYYDASWIAVAEEDASFLIKLALRPDPIYGEALYLLQAEAYRYVADPVLIAAFDTASYFGT